MLWRHPHSLSTLLHCQSFLSTSSCSLKPLSPSGTAAVPCLNVAWFHELDGLLPKLPTGLYSVILLQLQLCQCPVMQNCIIVSPLLLHFPSPRAWKTLWLWWSPGTWPLCDHVWLLGRQLCVATMGAGAWAAPLSPQRPASVNPHSVSARCLQGCAHLHGVEG